MYPMTRKIKERLLQLLAHLRVKQSDAPRRTRRVDASHQVGRRAHREKEPLRIVDLEQRIMLSATWVDPEHIDLDDANSVTTHDDFAALAESLLGPTAFDNAVGVFSGPIASDGYAPRDDPEWVAWEPPDNSKNSFLDALGDDPEFVLLEPKQTAKVQIVFVDAEVDGAEQLVDSLRAHFGENAELVLIDQQSHVLDKVSETLSHHRNVSAVHFITHGTDGAIKFGGNWITGDELRAQEELVRQWRASLSADADILFYGCDLAESEEGRLFLEQVADLTGADVAASDDLTGHSHLGGDWELEYSLGSIDGSIIIGESVADDWNGLLSTFTVTNTNDSGAGSLRQAIIDANALGGADTITFNISTADPGYVDPTPGSPLSGDEYWSISILTQLDTITDTVVLDATSQSGYVSSPVIELNGVSSNGANGLRLGAGSDNSVIRGFAINRFDLDGIGLSGNTNGIQIVGNYIGTDITGTIGLGNGDDGIQ
ncbi:MAG: DUF4347 domain-containing protein, partial [Rhizobiaceae bacterium]|nr:DUF4347 domain-containing protein [Rhizobiaceae bacterium]